MQFTSMAYLGFFCAVFAIYYICPLRFKWACLLAASVLFYSLFGVYMLAILFACTFVSYTLGIILAKKRSKIWLFCSIGVTLLPLLFFKYADSVFSLNQNTSFFSSLTPLGLSFFTFKIISYLIEVYTKKIKPCTHFGKYALYVTFFTQITSGPIQKPSELIGQIENIKEKFNYENAIKGTHLILFGLFKKLLIADALFKHVRIAFESHEVITGPAVILGALLYTIQIYCDFSGYCHIAMGCMNILGFTVPYNFKSPYFATSMRDFWSRWHITLSTFLKDYVYIPLGGNRKGKLRTYINIIITFLISGLWHGTGLQFIVWGILHGIYQVVGSATKNAKNKLYTALHIKQTGIFAICIKTCITFLLVSIAWVFFGAQSLQQALGMFAQMPVGISPSPSAWLHALAVLQFENMEILRIALFCVIAFIIDYKAKNQGFTQWFANLKAPLRIAICYVFIFSVVIYAPLLATPFIYFQF